MPRRRHRATPLDSPAEPAPFRVDPNGVYRPAQVIAALGLRASSLRSEWRAGRLRIVRRCGKNYLVGRDILAWLEAGELPSPAHRHQRSGAPD
jgi:hypothetical protein